MSTVPDAAEYRAIERTNDTPVAEYLRSLETDEDGRLVGQTTDGRTVIYTTGYPVKIKEVRRE